MPDLFLPQTKSCQSFLVVLNPLLQFLAAARRIDERLAQVGSRFLQFGYRLLDRVRLLDGKADRAAECVQFPACLVPLALKFQRRIRRRHRLFQNLCMWRREMKRRRREKGRRYSGHKHPAAAPNCLS